MCAFLAVMEATCPIQMGVLAAALVAIRVVAVVAVSIRVRPLVGIIKIRTQAAVRHRGAGAQQTRCPLAVAAALVCMVSATPGSVQALAPALRTAVSGVP